MNPTDFTEGSSRRSLQGFAGLGDTDVPRAVPLSPLTGRDAEVSLLADRWEQAQEGMGQVVQIIGEAGLGKSRLVQTIREIAQAEAGQLAVIEWRCAERFQSTGLSPVVDHLQRLFAFTPEETPSARLDRLALYLEEFGLGRPETVALFANLIFLPHDARYPAPGLTPVRERTETFRALREWLGACARRQPVLFVIEDLHWADASTLEFLGNFIAGDLCERVLAVLTFRPGFRAPWPAMAHQTSLSLNRLTRRQVAELMQKVAGRDLPAPLVAQIYQRTGGVPLLVEEFSRMARESAIFDNEHTREMPATLQQLVIARLDRMPGDHQVAHMAALLGREFHHELLAAVAGVDELLLQAELAMLGDAEIIYRNGHPPRCTYLFKHALLEEAVRAVPDDASRRRLHGRIAGTMEERFPQLAETQPELLAQHFTEAGVMERAVEYWLQAGRRSHERFANVEAISHLTRGLDLLRTLDESTERDVRELELLQPLGTAYIAARGYAAPEVGPVFDRALALAGSAPRTPRAFAVMRGHFAFQVVRGQFRLCASLAEEAMQLAGELGDPGVLMEALFLQGLTQFYRGDFEGARASFEQALGSHDDRGRTAYWATQTGEDSGVTHRCYLALALWHLGFPAPALAMNREARDLARSLQHPFSLEYALHHTGWLHQHCLLGMETQAAGEEEMRIATEQGFLFWHASGSLYFAAGLLLRGRHEEGLRLFQEALASYRATGAILGLPYYLGILGEAFVKAGRFEEGRRALAEALQLVEENDERFQEAELHRLDGELRLAESGDQEAASTCFRSALEIARRQGSRAWELRATVSLARLQHRQGRHEAFTILANASNGFDKGFETPDLAEAAALLKELGNERMRDDIAAGIKYVRDCIPPPLDGRVAAVDWRYVPSSTLGGDAIGYHWLDAEHIALYLIDVTGHGLDSALLSVTITNVIRSGSLAGADWRKPCSVLGSLNDAFQGSRHGHKFFTIWYGVYHTGTRCLTYASGGHPSAIAVVPGRPEPIVFPATGPMMGISLGMEFSATESVLPPGTRLFIFSDGVFELRRDRRPVWDLSSCIAYLALHGAREEQIMDALLAHIRGLRGSALLDDDFSFIDVRLH